MLSKWPRPGITLGRTDYKVDLGGPILVQEVESQVYQSQRRVAITGVLLDERGVNEEVACQT